MKKFAALERRKRMERTDAFFLAFGAMIGSGWVTMVGEWISRAGTIGAALAFILGGIVILCVSRLYADIIAELPAGGTMYSYCRQACGEKTAFVCMWLLILSYVSVISFQTVAFPTLLAALLPKYLHGYLYTIDGFEVYGSWLIVSVLISLLQIAVNVLGKKAASIFRTMTTLTVLICGAFILIGALISADTGNLSPAFSDGVSGVLKVTAMTPFLYIGFDVIPQTASQMNIPAKKIGQSLILSVLAAMAWYVLIILGVGLVLDAAQRSNSSLPSAAAVLKAYHGMNFAEYVLLLGGIAGVLSCWNAFYAGASRTICTLAEAGMLPAGLAARHPRYGTPYVAILMIGILTTVSTFLGKNMLVYFTNAGSFGAVATYSIVSVAYMKLHKVPDSVLLQKRKTCRPLTDAAPICALGLLSLYFPGMPSALAWPFEWGIIIVWTIIGVVLYTCVAYGKKQ